MKYLFILGRNPKLSFEEVKAFFTLEGNKILDYSINKNGLLVELEKPIDKIIDKFGGIISIGEVLSSIEKLDNIEIYSGEKNNITYLVWDFSEQTSDVEDYLKKKFHNEKLKASKKNFSSEMTLQSGEKIPSSSFNRKIDEEYFVFEDYFGKIIQKSNYEEMEFRDMNKPVRREFLSISPRLSKIMINLSLTKQYEKIVDAFCGIGSILQEALLKEIKVIGIEKDKQAIEGAKQNLNFGNFEKKNYELINADSRKVKISEVSAMVSEPDLGRILKKIPTKGEAENILRGFENLIIDVINNLKYSIKGRIVFTAPCIKQINKRMSCDFNRILKATGYKLVQGFPISEFREDQIVGRDVVVLEKNSS